MKLPFATYTCNWLTDFFHLAVLLKDHSDYAIGNNYIVFQYFNEVYWCVGFTSK